MLRSNKVKEGKALDLKLYWLIGKPVLGLGQGVGIVSVQIGEYMFCHK